MIGASSVTLQPVPVEYICLFEIDLAFATGGLQQIFFRHTVAYQLYFSFTSNNSIRFLGFFVISGGAFPFTIGRIEHGFNVRPDLCAVENDVNPRKYLGKIYTDSLVHDPGALEYLIKTIGEVRTKGFVLQFFFFYVSNINTVRKWCSLPIVQQFLSLLNYVSH